MTTVIATLKGIYSDTHCSYTIPFRVVKVAQICKSVFAGAGDLDDLVRFFEWRRAGGKRIAAPVFEDGIDILEVCSDGIFIWGKKLVRLKINQGIYAVGSGAQYATGAMELGATPEQAIEVAAKFDVSTALPIEFTKFKR